MTAFVDSSALVKLYVPEAGYHAVRALSPPLLVSELARVEVPAAFWRKHRIGEIEAADAAVLTRAFEVDLQGGASEAPLLTALAVGSAVLDDAARLVAVHPLRAYDAVQLATAIAAQLALASALEFAAFDKALRAAAAAEGLSLAPARR